MFATNTVATTKLPCTSPKRDSAFIIETRSAIVTSYARLVRSSASRCLFANATPFFTRDFDVRMCITLRTRCRCFLRDTGEAKRRTQLT